MRRVLRSGPPPAATLVTAWAAAFTALLAVRLVLQRAGALPRMSLVWLQVGSVVLLGLLVLGAALGARVPPVGRIVLRIEQAAIFIAITRLLGLGAQGAPGRAEQVLIALLGLHAVGAIVTSEELRPGTPPWRAALWVLAMSFGALTLSVLDRGSTGWISPWHRFHL